MTDYERVRPCDLRAGDVVAEHGMRLRVETAPILSASHPDGRTFYVDALVLNRADVPSDRVPYAFTERRDGAHRWTLQGNDLARVSRVVPKT